MAWCRQHTEELVLQAEERSQGFLNPVGRSLTMVRIAIFVGGDRIKEIQLYYSY